MKFSIMFVTSDYRGDHAADVRIAHELKDGETVEQLAKRILCREETNPFAEGDPVEQTWDHFGFIEIRAIKPVATRLAP